MEEAHPRVEAAVQPGCQTTQTLVTTVLLEGDQTPVYTIRPDGKVLRSAGYGDNESIRPLGGEQVTTGVQTAEDSIEPPPAAIELELLGYLRYLTHGAERTRYTPASLNRMAGNWCEENKSRLGPYQQWSLRADLIARCVNAVIPPGLAEAGLIEMYQREGARIQAFNRGLVEMGDHRWDLRPVVAAVGAAAVVTGVALRTGGFKTAASGILSGVGVAGLAWVAASKGRDLFRTLGAARWF